MQQVLPDIFPVECIPKPEKMKKREKAKLSSYNQIYKSLTENDLVFKNNESSQKAIGTFTGYLSNIKNLSWKLNKSVKWLTQTKSKLRKIVTEEALILVASMIRLSNNTGNLELRETVHYDPSDLERMNYPDFHNAVKKIHKLAETHKAELLPYNIDEERPATFKENINKLTDTTNQRIDIKNENKQNALAFKAAIKTMDNFLKERLDWEIKGHGLAHPEVAASYFAARKLPKLPVQHIPLRGHIIDKESKEPIANGTVSVVEINLQTIITQKGNFTFKHVPEGRFTLKVENMKYKPLLVNLQRYNNEYLNIEIEVEPKPVASIPEI